MTGFGSTGQARSCGVVSCDLPHAKGRGSSSLTTVSDSYAEGFTEGVQAGRSEMNYRDRRNGPDAAAHIEAHALFDGRYELVSRDYGLFGSHEFCSLWMAGVVEGCMSVGARMGLTTSTRASATDTAEMPRLHVVIVKDGWS